jgi:hypothetical protein
VGIDAADELRALLGEVKGPAATKERVVLHQRVGNGLATGLTVPWEQNWEHGGERHRSAQHAIRGQYRRSTISTLASDDPATGDS